MKRLAMAGFFACVLFVTGCGKMTGQWTLDCIEPESERQNFDLKCLVLNEDNTFLVRACAEAKTAQMSGTYCYDKNTKALTFKPQNGPERTYTAEVGLSGRMKVCPANQATWTAYLKPCKCDNDDKCAKTCNKPCNKPCNRPCDKKATECKPAEKKSECPMHQGEPLKIEPRSPKN